MTMENRAGIKVNLICGRCKKMFLRPAVTIRPEQKDFFCSRECLKKTTEEKSTIRRQCKRNWVQKNREKHLESRKKWRLANPDNIRAAKKRDYEKHKEKRKIIQKIYTEKNKDKLFLKRKEYYKNNREIIRKRAKEHREKHPELMQKYRKLHRKNNRHSVLWSNTKKSAKIAGVNFNLTQEWIKNRLDSGVCEMTNLPFDMEGKRTKNSPSVDRIQPGGDYTMDNCRLILWSLNHALSNYGENYMFKVFEAALFKKRASA